MAPELLSDQNEGHNNKVDIWALGVIAFNLFSGANLPFDEKDEDTGDESG